MRAQNVEEWVKLILQYCGKTVTTMLSNFSIKFRHMVAKFIQTDCHEAY